MGEARGSRDNGRLTQVIAAADFDPYAVLFRRAEVFPGAEAGGAASGIVGIAARNLVFSLGDSEGEGFVTLNAIDQGV